MFTPGCCAVGGTGKTRKDGRHLVTPSPAAAAMVQLSNQGSFLNDPLPASPSKPFCTHKADQRTASFLLWGNALGEGNHNTVELGKGTF